MHWCPSKDNFSSSKCYRPARYWYSWEFPRTTERKSPKNRHFRKRRNCTRISQCGRLSLNAYFLFLTFMSSLHTGSWRFVRSTGLLRTIILATLSLTRLLQLSSFLLSWQNESSEWMSAIQIMQKSLKCLLLTPNRRILPNSGLKMIKQQASCSSKSWWKVLWLLPFTGGHSLGPLWLHESKLKDFINNAQTSEYQNGRLNVLRIEVSV